MNTKYRVETSKQSVVIEAASPRHAVVKAVSNESFSNFGYLVSAELENNIDEEKIIYFDSLQILQDCGFEVNEL